jgi:hypothetical protein
MASKCEIPITNLFFTNGQTFSQVEKNLTLIHYGAKKLKMVVSIGPGMFWSKHFILFQIWLARIVYQNF